MAKRELPLSGRNFQVILGVEGVRGGSGRQLEVAISDVVFPSFRLDQRNRIDDRTPPPMGPAASENLVLRRGYTGGRELSALWRAARDKENQQLRSVEVTVLNESLERAATWQFTGCHVVSLDYTTLDALDGGVLKESLEISFKQMEQPKI